MQLGAMMVLNKIRFGFQKHKQITAIAVWLVLALMLAAPTAGALTSSASLQSYGTVTSTQPTPTPTVYPTATPTPAPNGNNLAPFPSGWIIDYPYGSSAPGGNVFHDTSTTYNNAYTFRIDPTSENRGADYGNGVAISPGKHVVITCWIKTAGVSAGSGQGARLGMDLYSNIGGIEPIYTDNVAWGTDWTLVTWSFTVANQYPYIEGSTGQTGHYSNGQMVTPTYCLPWINVNTPNYPTGGYSAWFSGYSFTIS